MNGFNFATSYCVYTIYKGTKDKPDRYIQNRADFPNEESAIDFARKLHYYGADNNLSYEITVRPNIGGNAVLCFDSQFERMPLPTDSVFVIVGGRDCDRYRFQNMYAFNNLREAADFVDDVMQHADGPMYYFTIDRPQYMTAKYDSGFGAFYWEDDNGS